MKKRLLALLMSFTVAASYMPALPVMAADEGDEVALTIYYTNDVHTYIKDASAPDSKGNPQMSYATLAQLKADKVAAGEEVLLLDAGDHVQGTAYGSMDKGTHIIQFMNEAGYDAATLGNHEFDYGMEQALANVDAAEYAYLSSNFLEDTDQDGTWDPVLAPYKIFDKGGLKVAVVGVTTPETFTKSTPAYFQNEDGEFIYDIKGGKDGQNLYDAVQTSIDAAQAEGADLVIGLGHLGIDTSSSPWTSRELISNVTGLDAFIDGHSHSAVANETVTDKDGNSVVLTQTGEKLGNIGQMTIEKDGDIETELIVSDVYQPELNAKEVSWMQEIDEALGTEIAESEIEFTTKYADGNRAIRQTETNLGNLNADAYYYYINEVANLDCDVALMNGGGIRADVAPGTWTYKTAKTVNTFGNVLCLMEVPGQMLLDALEWGSQFGMSGENGGFLHPAGLTYKIDDSIPCTVQKDENNIWTGAPTGEYRVYDVKVYNRENGTYEPLDLKKTYTLGGANYTLRHQGDGFNMFRESAGMTLVMEGISEDYMAMSTYVSAFADTDANGIANIATANSPLCKYTGYLMNYENATGAGRIVYGTKPAAEPETIELGTPSVKAALTAYNAAKISWKAVQNAEYYKVFYKKAGAAEWKSKTVTKTSLQLSKMGTGSKYKFKVVAYAKKNGTTFRSTASSVQSVTTLKKLPAPKLAKNKTKVKVSFKNIAGETGYEISASGKKTGTNVIATVKSTKAASKTVAVTKGKKLYYKVRAYVTVNGKKLYTPWSAVKVYTLK